MRKKDELAPGGDTCMAHAHPEEMVFVLLSRDAAAPVAIRAWVAERLRLGKNIETDEQIVEALECASTMEKEGCLWTGPYPGLTARGWRRGVSSSDSGSSVSTKQGDDTRRWSPMSDLMVRMVGIDPEVIISGDRATVLRLVALANGLKDEDDVDVRQSPIDEDLLVVDASQAASNPQFLAVVVPEPQMDPGWEDRCVERARREGVLPTSPLTDGDLMVADVLSRDS